jgi:hypothetical protein
MLALIRKQLQDNFFLSYSSHFTALALLFSRFIADRTRLGLGHVNIGNLQRSPNTLVGGRCRLG